MSQTTTAQDISVSVVVPAKNEADNIHKLVTEICLAFEGRDDFEIIYVDDGSNDATAVNVVKAAYAFPNKVKLIQHEQSVGQSTAIYSGVKAAKGRLIVTLDADGQNNPTDIAKLLMFAIRYSISSDFCIAGYRKARKDTAWKRFQSKVANKVRSTLLKDDTPDTGCGLKVFPKATFLKLPYFDHMHRYLPALIKRVGGSIDIVEVSHRDREHGQSKYGMWGRLFAGLVDMLGVMWLQKRSHIPQIKVVTAIIDEPLGSNEPYEQQ
jgi:glycosyltransferase involved in cell wall biosynthesis